MEYSRVPLTGNGLPTVYVDLSVCYESFPCQHIVTDASGKEDLLFAGQIVQLYKDRGMVPGSHFSDQSIVEPKYAEDVEFNDEEVAALLDQDNDSGDAGHCNACCCCDNN